MIVAARMVRDRRAALLWWSLGVVAMAVFTLAIYPSVRGSTQIEDLLESLPEALRRMVSTDPNVPLMSPAGYLNARLYASIGPVLMIVFGIGVGAQAIGGYEEAGYLEPLLANPVTRSRVAVERYLAAVAMLAGLTAVLAASVYLLAAAFDALEGLSTSGFIGANVALFGFALLHLSVAYAVGAATGRRGPAVGAAAALAVAGFLVYNLLTVAPVLAPLRFVTPWYWNLQRNMLASGAVPGAIVAPLAISVLLFGLGWFAFQRRDLR